MSRRCIVKAFHRTVLMRAYHDAALSLFQPICRTDRRRSRHSPLRMPRRRMTLCFNPPCALPAFIEA